ncbi:MAG: hypothetical protein Q7S61_04980 [bacterium]|nr:hypothetical protein [bacterium]
MQDLSIHDVIKIIPLEEAEKEKLLNEFDLYEDSLKFEVEKVIWKAFIEMKNVMIDAKYEQFLAEIELGERKLTTGLMDDVRKAVWADMQDIRGGKWKENSEIQNIRQKLQRYVATVKQ